MLLILYFYTVEPTACTLRSAAYIDRHGSL